MSNLSKQGSDKKGEVLVSKLISYLGENSKREGLLETPTRVIKMYRELLSGYKEDLSGFYKTFNSKGYKGIVTLTNIDFYSLCEHHMVPFFGKVHIGYVPNGKVLGLSKFARVVEAYSKRLQTQENLTKQIADSFTKYLVPVGLVVHVEAEHLCMSMRGVKSRGVVTKTTDIRGVLKDQKELLDQFYKDISGHKLKSYDSN